MGYVIKLYRLFNGGTRIKLVFIECTVSTPFNSNSN